MTARQLIDLLYEVNENTPVTIKTETMNPLKMIFSVHSAKTTETSTPDGKKTVSMTIVCKWKEAAP